MKPVSASINKTLKLLCFNGGLAKADELDFSLASEGRIHQIYKAKSTSNEFILQCINTNVISDPYALARVTRLGLTHAGFTNAVLQWPATGSDILEVDGQFWMYRVYIPGEPLTLPVTASALHCIGQTLHALHSSITVSDFNACNFRGVNPWSKAAAKALAARVHNESREIGHAEQRIIEELQTIELQLSAKKEKWFSVPTNRIGNSTTAIELQVIVHRDTKPSNFIHRDDGSMTLIDFDTLGLGDPAQDLGEVIRAIVTTDKDTTANHAKLPDKVKVIEDIHALCTGYDNATMTYERVLLASAYSCLWQCQRYLDDHLAGNKYYRVSKAGENLDHSEHQMQALNLLVTLFYNS